MPVQVAILLSTYNGEKYLTEQIKSIQKQTFTNWHLYIRDDKSTDSTTSIIHRFVKLDSRISFINESNIINLGVKKSFLQLLSEAKSNYYMFCDQDDVWLPDKITLTLGAMLKIDASGPCLVHTDLYVVDSELHKLGLMYGNDFHNEFKDNLYSNSVTGCTMMLNNMARTLILSSDFDSSLIVMHDWWFALIISAFGQIQFVHKPTILYRQHDNNTFGAQISTFERLQRLFKLKNETKRFAEALKQDIYFATTFNSKLSNEQKRLIKVPISIFNSKSNINNFFILVKNKVHKSTRKGTFLLWLVFTTQQKNLIKIWGKNND